MRGGSRGGAAVTVVALLTLLIFLGIGGALFAYRSGYLRFGQPIEETLASLGIQAPDAAAPVAEAQDAPAAAPAGAPAGQPGAAPIAPTPAPNGAGTELSAIPVPAKAMAPVAAAAAPRTDVTLTISSDPEGVEVYLDGELKGVTPTRLTLPKSDDKKAALTFKKEGYIDASQEVPLSGDVPVIARLAETKAAKAAKEVARPAPRPAGKSGAGAGGKKSAGETDKEKVQSLVRSRE
jgi:hypothetical protein